MIERHSVDHPFRIALRCPDIQFSEIYIPSIIPYYLDDFVSDIPDTPVAIPDIFSVTV